MHHPVSAQTLQDMKTYYQERAREYDEWFYRQRRFDRGPAANASWFTEVDEVFTAFDAVHFTGEVLELAPGTGIWTERLARTASTILAVDASAEMIELNRAKVSSDRVTYLQADLFTWRPQRVYDGILFSFWISHVPLERLDGFLSSVAAMLRPGGKVFFVDGQRSSDGSAAHQQTPSQESQLTKRILNNGQTFEIVKYYYDPTDLATRCRQAGLNITIHETATHFLYGYRK